MPATAEGCSAESLAPGLSKLLSATETRDQAESNVVHDPRQSSDRFVPDNPFPETRVNYDQDDHIEA